MFIKAAHGAKIPAIGLGTSGVPNPEALEKAVDVALAAGYRHLDTAAIYRNEKTLGKALRKWFDAGKLKREEVFVTTKLPPSGVHPDRVEKFVKMSLKNLELDYVDTYLVHGPIGCIGDDSNPATPARDETGRIKMEGKTDHVAVWKKMEEQVVAGRTKTIGLSNYSIDQIDLILKNAKIKPSFLQMEMHVYFQQKKVVEFCRKNDIIFVAYAPLGSPGYNEKMYNFHKNFKTVSLPNILNDPKINQIAEKYSKNPAQIMLRFLVQSGVAATPKSMTPKRIIDNFAIFDFKLDPDDMATLQSLDRGEKGRVFDMAPFTGFKDHPDFPYPK